MTKVVPVLATESEVLDPRILTVRFNTDAEREQWKKICAELGVDESQLALSILRNFVGYCTGRIPKGLPNIKILSLPQGVVSE